MAEQHNLQLQEQSKKYDLNHHQVSNQFYAMAAAFSQPEQRNLPGISQAIGYELQPTPLHRQSNQQQQQQNSPTPGSLEHTRLKKETHRQVERRRRETINNGIQQLSDLIPGGEKNKGRIIMRAIQYIRELQQSESNNIEKYTMEKMIFERA